MRRLGASIAALLLVGTMLGAGPPAAAAAGTGCGDVHGFTSTVSLPAGFWSTGPHTVTWEWPAFEWTFEGSFEVRDDAPMVQGYVWIAPSYLTPGTADLLGYGDVLLDAVNPAQPTIIGDVLGGPELTQRDLVAIHDTTFETMAWDGEPAVTAHFSGVGSICQVGGPNKQTSLYIRNRPGRP